MIRPLATYDPSAGPHPPGPFGGVNPDHPSWITVGDHLVELAVAAGGLKAGERLLDVGCGTGRLAAALWRAGMAVTYVGVDVHPGYVACAGRRTPAGDFRHLDVQHAEYNPAGGLDAPAEARALRAGGPQDLIVCIALFNHLPLAAVEALVAAAAAVLRPRGRLLATCFLFGGPAAGPRSLTFAHPHGDSLAQDPERPLLNLAHPEERLRRACMSAGLVLREPLRYGQWRGHPLALTGHDLLLADLP